MVSIQILCTCCIASTLHKGNVIMTKVCYFSCMSEQWKCGEMLLKTNWYFLWIPWSTVATSLRQVYTHTYIYALYNYNMLNIDSLYIPCSRNFVTWFTEHLYLGSLYLLNICALCLHLVNICAVDIWKVILHLYSNSLTVEPLCQTCYCAANKFLSY